MAWDRETRAGAMEQVDKLIAAGMGKKDAVKEVAGEVGIHPRTIETWLWPNKRKKRKSGESSPSESSLFTLTEKENIGAKDALHNVELFVFARSLVDEENSVTVKSWDAGGTPVSVDEWVQEAKDRGHSDAAVLAGLAVVLYGEASRLKKLNTALEAKL